MFSILPKTVRPHDDEPDQVTHTVLVTATTRPAHEPDRLIKAMCESTTIDLAHMAVTTAQTVEDAARRALPAHDVDAVVAHVLTSGGRKFTRWTYTFKPAEPCTSSCER